MNAAKITVISASMQMNPMRSIYKMEYLFGPVLSRRLGLSMGVDLLAHKTCNLDCIYCELGRTPCISQRRDRFVPPDKVLREIKSKANDEFDHITFAGSGEPTLSIDLGDIIRKTKAIVDAPVAVITNSTLLSSQQVREEIKAADIVLPSLDAVTQEIFQAINRPSPGLRIENIIEGLKAFRKAFKGEIWLEIMLVKDTNEHEARLISTVAESIEPDRIQLNTVVRPPAEPVLPLEKDEMLQVLEVFQEAEIIPDWDWKVPTEIEEDLFDLLSRKSCTFDEVKTQLELGKNDVIKYLSIMERDGLLSRHLQKGILYFRASKKA
ncbi:MAG: radical SAM protein [Methanotrichaceae archaeon]|nr:radical SAM protein [Methanotrichaceae archaeon]